MVFQAVSFMEIFRAEITPGGFGLCVECRIAGLTTVDRFIAVIRDVGVIQR